MPVGTTLTKHFMEQQKIHPGATGEFTSLLSEILVAAKIVSREVNKAGLVEILGLTGKTNIQGEKVQKLDVFANETLIRNLEHTGHICAMASEEVVDIITIPDEYPQDGKYVFIFDPLDGSSNIDANVSIGTIFSIHKRISTEGKATQEDILQKGSKQVAAGYIIYGSSTVFVYTTGHGVHGFTLDPSVGEFFLSHEDIKIPERGKIYSVNEAYYNLWDDRLKRFVDHLREPDEKGKTRRSRYIGSLVADFHRNLLYGGLFMYPADSKNPNGKLRLLYEASPLAFIVEHAGGRASNGHENILDIQPTELHQRVPLYIGSALDVQDAESYLKE